MPEIPAGNTAFGPQTWHLSQPYLYAIDLFNLGYWWEAHEVLENLWQASGKTTVTGRFLQGIIQVAAALLQVSKGNRRGAVRLAARGRANLEAAAGVFGGIDVGVFLQAVDLYLVGERPSPPQIELHFQDNR